MRHIFSYLEDELECLRIIGLVSRRWRNCSVQYLFSSIELTDEADFKKFKSLLGWRPEVVNYVHSFSWDSGRRFWKTHDWKSGTFPSTKDIDAETMDLVNPPPIPLPRFPNVTSLRWTTVHKQPVRVGPSITLLLSSFPSISSLWFNCSFRNIGAIEEFLCLCGKNIQKLAFGPFEVIETFEFKSLQLPASDYSLEKLETLIFEDGRAEYFWMPHRLFRFQGCLPRCLKTLTVGEAPFDGDGLPEMINLFADTLENLTLDPPCKSSRKVSFFCRL